MDKASTSKTDGAFRGVVEFKPQGGTLRPAAGAANRRQHVRHMLARPCTLHGARAADPVPATTANISAGGALLCVPRATDFAAGESVSVVIALLDEADLASAPFRRARVVRVTPMDCHHQAVAVQFEEAKGLAQAA